MEVLTKVDEVLARIVQCEKVRGYLVDLFDSTNKDKQILLGDFVLVVDRQVFELRKGIIARGISQFVIVLCISLNNFTPELVIGSYILKENLNIVESSEQHFAGGNAQNVGGQALFDSTNIKNDLAILIIPEAINRREELTNGVREEMAILGIFGIVDFQQRMYVAICSIYLLIQMPQNCRITPHIIASFHDATRFGIALNGSIKVVGDKVRVLGNICELHKLNTLVQLIPLPEYTTTYGISVLTYLTKGASQSVTRILHSGRRVLVNNGIVMDGHFKAPIDIVPRGVNLGILFLIIK